MLRSTLGMLLIAACVSAQASTNDLPEAIRTIAGAHSAGRVRTTDATTYRLYVYRAPRGYRTEITLVEPTFGPKTVIATIYESKGGQQHGTMLIDTDADGTLDSVIRAVNPTFSGLRQLFRSTHATEPSPANEEEYAVLLHAVQETATTYRAKR